MLGSDGVSDALPGGATPGWPLPLHQCCLVGMGVHLLDNLALAELASGLRGAQALAVPAQRGAAARRGRHRLAR